MSPFRLFRRRPKQRDRASAPSTEAGQRLYVFGDVHGRQDLLIAMFAAIQRDQEQSPAGTASVVGLGDYIDRGPASKEVLQILTEGARGSPLVCLRGNHEQMLLDFLEDPVRCGRGWLAIGGEATLRSYSVTIGSLSRATAAELKSTREMLAQTISPAHVLFLQRLPLTYQSGDYLFVHAGVRPERPLSRQLPADLLWIREGFADDDRPFEKVVVHGHTPVERPFFGEHRINIDTGAYFSGRLTCIVLEGADRRVLEF